MVWKVSGQGNVVGGMSSLGSIRQGTFLWGSVSLGNAHEEVSVGELLGGEFTSETFSEELL